MPKPKSKYQRKTKDVYILMGNYGYGWDELIKYDNYSEAKKELVVYNENERFPHKIIKKREKIHNKEVNNE